MAGNNHRITVNFSEMDNINHEYQKMFASSLQEMKRVAIGKGTNLLGLIPTIDSGEAWMPVQKS